MDASQGGGWRIDSDPTPPGEVARFTTSQVTWSSVSVSPDGQRLVFDALGSLHTVALEGGTAVPVHGPGSPGDPGRTAMNRMPSWSPDGKRVLYLSDADGWENIWSCAPDGTAVQQLTFECRELPTDPIWLSLIHI